MAVSALKRTTMKKLDDIDLRILTILYKDADITNKELSIQIGIAPSTCLERVKRLKQSGVVKNSFIDVDFKSTGGNIEAIAAIRLQPYSEEIVNKLRDDLLKLPEIVSLYHMGGNYDYFIHMSVKDTEHLRGFVFDAITSRDEVTTVETSLVFEHSRSGVLPNFKEE
jgi:DNA-binding Lrp family transcriptional regulator